MLSAHDDACLLSRSQFVDKMSGHVCFLLTCCLLTVLANKNTIVTHRDRDVISLIKVVNNTEIKLVITNYESLKYLEDSSDDEEEELWDALHVFVAELPQLPNIITSVTAKVATSNTPTSTTSIMTQTAVTHTMLTVAQVTSLHDASATIHVPAQHSTSATTLRTLLGTTPATALRTSPATTLHTSPATTLHTSPATTLHTSPATTLHTSPATTLHISNWTTIDRAFITSSTLGSDYSQTSDNISVTSTSAAATSTETPFTNLTSRSSASLRTVWRPANISNFSTSTAAASWSSPTASVTAGSPAAAASWSTTTTSGSTTTISGSTTTISGSTTTISGSTTTISGSTTTTSGSTTTKIYPSCLLKELLSSTSDPAKLTVAQVKHYTNQILSLYEAVIEDRQIARKAFRVVGNLARVNMSVSLGAESDSQTNTRLREFLDNYTSQVSLADTSDVVDISTPELHVKVMSVQEFNTSDNGVLTFLPFLTDESNISSEVNITLKLPDHIFSTADQTTRIQFVAYRRSQLFVPDGGFPEEINSLDLQKVISASIKGKAIRNLTTPVEIILPKIQSGRRHRCVFWDVHKCTWSTEGITLFSEDFHGVACQSTHLTSFAVLMDVSHSLSPQQEMTLTYLTYTGCGISMSCLLITVITYTMFRCLNKEKSGKILLSLCMALLLLNVAFLLATINVSNYSDLSCMAVGMLLHYFMLAALMWMLVEAVEMYQALVTIFSKYERFFLFKRCLLAWGMPAVVVAITASLDRESYYKEKQDKNVCFLTNSRPATFFAAHFGPSCIIIVVNTAIFIVVSRVILKHSFQKVKTIANFITPAQIRGMFAVMFLLGVTWIFGPLAVGETQLTLNYLFCICNSLQGFFIFIFRCLFNPEAKLAWVQLIRTGTFKRRRGQILILTSGATSKSADRRDSSGSNAITSTVSTDSYSHGVQATTRNWDPDHRGFLPDQNGKRNR